MCFKSVASYPGLGTRLGLKFSCGSCSDEMCLCSRSYRAVVVAVMRSVCVHAAIEL